MTDFFKRIIEITADGSHTLFVPGMDEHYHSVNGAIQESQHVFIEAGLKECKKKNIRVLEIGFGTGLNAFLTLLFTEDTQYLTVDYITIEKYPLDIQTVSALNYPVRICPEKEENYRQLHTTPWEQLTPITPLFNLHKIKGDSNIIELPENIDVIFFDAFGPDKQPEMWNQEIFNKLYQKMSQGGIITTYCAKGSVRRMMKEAGFTMERIPGPPGKREMLRGRK